MKITSVNFKTILIVACSNLLFLPSNAQIQKGADIEGEADGDGSGFSVSMPDANTIAIGSVNNDANGEDAGHVRIYSWGGTSWVQKGSDIEGEADGDGSGFSVSMPNANTIAIGAVNNDANGEDAGHVRIYSWGDTSWVQKGSDIDGEAAGDKSGWRVSMPDANTIAIGAINNSGNGEHSGHVRIYSWSGTAWMQKGTDIDGESAFDQSGYSVSMPDANTIAIGSPFNDGHGEDAGQVRIYSWSGNEWVQKGLNIVGTEAHKALGFSISMPDSNTIAIGAPFNEVPSEETGQVRIYNWSGTAWVQKGFHINGEDKYGIFGKSISMPDANTVAIGDNLMGKVSVYHWSLSRWLLASSVIYSEENNDESGWSISMPDAHTIAVGAPSHNGNGKGLGYVRVFSFGE